MDWKIYYGDGTTFSSEQGPPEKAPALNVQVVAQKDSQCGRVLLSGKDYYLFQNGEWIGLDLFGVLDHMIQAGILKAGRTLTNEPFRAILAEAISDPDLPPKSARWDALEQNRPNL